MSRQGNLRLLPKEEDGSHESMAEFARDQTIHSHRSRPGTLPLEVSAAAGRSGAGLLSDSPRAAGGRLLCGSAQQRVPLLFLPGPRRSAGSGGRHGTLLAPPGRPLITCIRRESPKVCSKVPENRGFLPKLFASVARFPKIRPQSPSGFSFWIGRA